MKKGINYGLFMITTMGLIYSNNINFIQFSYGIGTIWSIHMLWHHLIIEEKWDWFFSSTLTWQLIGIFYLIEVKQPILIIPYTGILLSFAFGINAVVSLVSPMPFTTLFDNERWNHKKNNQLVERRQYLTIHMKGTLLWTMVILINILFNLLLHRYSYNNLAVLTMINVGFGIFFIKKYLKNQLSLSD